MCIRDRLNIVQTRLREILAKNRDGMLSWDSMKLRHVGDDLLKLSVDLYPHLALVEHKVLCQSIREAGLGIRRRATLISERKIRDEDKEYFESVYEALLNLYKKIESGEYYRALLEIADKKTKKEK